MMARRATGKKVRVKLRREPDSFTEIKIRGGIFGDGFMCPRRF
jgi:hypothetical protein